MQRPHGGNVCVLLTESSTFYSVSKDQKMTSANNIGFFSKSTEAKREIRLQRRRERERARGASEIANEREAR